MRVLDSSKSKDLPFCRATKPKRAKTKINQGLRFDDPSIEAALALRFGSVCTVPHSFRFGSGVVSAVYCLFVSSPKNPNRPFAVFALWWSALVCTALFQKKNCSWLAPLGR